MAQRLKEQALARLGFVNDLDVNPAPGTTTTIFTVPIGKIAIVTHVVLHGCSGDMTTASLSFGFDAAGSDCIADSTYVSIDGTTKYVVVKAEDGAVHGVAAETFKVAVNTAQGAAMTLDVDVFGFHVDA